MASIKDLYTEIAKMRGRDFGELRHVARTLQSAELLPKAGRRERMHPPQITSKDCATFLIGLSASRTSGARMPAVLKRRVRRFKSLTHIEDDGTARNFFNDLVALIDNYRDTAWVKDVYREDKASGRRPARLVFINDDPEPQVWIEQYCLDKRDEEGKLVEERLSYALPRSHDQAAADLDPERDEFWADAFYMPVGVFFRLRDILGPRERKDTV